MSRVLVLTDLFPTAQRPRGAPFIQERLDAHRAAGVEVDRIDIRLRPKQPLRTMLVRTGRDVEDPLPDSGPFVGLKTGPVDYWRLRRSRDRRRWALDVADQVDSMRSVAGYDAIHAHGMYRAGAGLVAQILSDRHGLPYAVSVHGSDINIGMPNRPAEFIETFRRARAVMYVSPALRERALTLGAPEEGSVVTGNGVNLDLFPAGAAERTSEVLFVGNLAHVKGADRLPAIFQHVHDNNPAATFTVIGVGPLEDEIRAQVQALPVNFLGAQDRAQVAEAMRRASVLVIPSRNEGWPTVINEALASGTPVAATDVGGVRQALQHDDWLIPAEPEPAVQLAQVVIRLLGEPVDRASLRAQAAHFSWTAIAERERTALGIA